jgi:glucose-1-phosphate adenylyltransferase
VLLPGVTVEPGAVVEYAILGENCSIGRNCRVGGTPGTAGWGLTVLAPGCQVAAEQTVRPGIMLDRKGEEVSR